jgi:hypothetical protein
MNRPQEVGRDSWIVDLLDAALNEVNARHIQCDEYDLEVVKILAREWAPYSTLSEWVN